MGTGPGFAAITVTDNRFFSVSSTAAPIMICACSHWRPICSITRFTSAMASSFPPIKLTSTALDSASARPSSSSGCAINFSNDLARARRTGGFNAGEHTLGMAVAKQRAQIVEMNLDQTLPREQTPDATHTFNEQSVSNAERVKHAGVLVNQFEGFSGRAGR